MPNGQGLLPVSVSGDPRGVGVSKDSGRPVLSRRHGGTEEWEANSIGALLSVSLYLCERNRVPVTPNLKSEI
jgi:hypothetical protein